MNCAFCDRPITEDDFGGEFTFMGDGVVEQHILVRLCGYHWRKFYDNALRRGGWLPPLDDAITLATVVPSTDEMYAEWNAFINERAIGAS